MDWNEAAANLKRRLREGGRGFLTIQKDTLRAAFEIGALKERNANELAIKLREHRMCIFPHPYVGGSTFRIYDLDREIGQIAMAVSEPDDIPETALADVGRLYDRERAAKDMRSDDVPWPQALDVFFQVLIGRPPEGWEDLRDDRHPQELAADLATSLELPAGLTDASETIRLAGAVCAQRPRGPRWDGPSSALSEAFVEADRKQKELFDRVLREAAKHLLGKDDVPTGPVELGRLGLRFRREAQGGLGWIR
jgi:hypothetical protein